MALSRDNIEKLIDEAQGAIQRGQFDRAIRAYLSVIEIDPYDLKSLSKLAELYVKVGSKHLAIPAYLQIAQSYERQNQSYQAYPFYEQISQLDVEREDVRLWMMRYCLQNAEIEQGYAQFLFLKQKYESKQQFDRVSEI